MIHDLTPSPAVNEAVKKAKLAGNEVREILQTRPTTEKHVKQIVYMRNCLTDELRLELKSDIRLRYELFNYDSHYAASEFFFDDEIRVLLDFPANYQDLIG